MAARNQESVPSFGYPRPQLQRQRWVDLNGTWDFAIDAEARWTRPDEVKFNKAIRVPYAPETPASGIEAEGYFSAVWYQREAPAPKLKKSERLLLHFGAVDHIATVWVNGEMVARHEGGYTPFFADITEQADAGGPLVIVVRAYDDPHDLGKPRGKQDWLPKPHGIWYPRTTGIWQSVWMEVVPATRIDSVQWVPDMTRWEIGVEVRIEGPLREGMHVRVRLTACDEVQAEDAYQLSGTTLRRQIALADPGIDDSRNRLLWRPAVPQLIDAELVLVDEAGKVIDQISSYTAMRSVAVVGNRFILNGRPFKPMMLLDQGYWPETGLTAPDDAAYRHDVELVKQMGFNGVRKHQKIENPRFLYWADKLGLIVWEEMPSPYQFSRESTERLTREWIDVIRRDISHPCIVAWVPFNESWGVPDLPDSPAQRHCVQALYHLTRTLDPMRPVIGNDGWEAAATDIVGIHDYERDPQALVRRYRKTGDQIQEALADERPGGRALLLPGFSYEGHPIMLTEFGGIALHKDTKHTWGYSRASSSEDLAARYAYLLAGVRALPLFSGFCYTQFTDTYQEANGLLYMDRTPKFPIEQIAIATRGARNEEELEIEAGWREQVEQRRQESEARSLDGLFR